MDNLLEYEEFSEELDKKKIAKKTSQEEVTEEKLKEEDNEKGAN